MAIQSNTGSSLPAVIDFTARDFPSVKAALIEFLKQRYPDDYTDFTESALGIMLLELAAYGVAINSFYLDRVANESYIEVARERRSMNKLTRLVGYRMSLPTAASVDLNIQGADIAAYQQVIVPKGQVLSATGGVSFELTEDYTLELVGSDWWVNGEDRGPDPYISASEGITYTETFTADGSSFARFRLSNDPVISGSVSVKVGGVEWTSVDSLLLGDPNDRTNQRIYEVTVDENDTGVIRFGDNLTGEAPARGTTISVTYRVGGGSQGNIASNTIAQPVDALGVPVGGGPQESFTLQVVNSNPASGGTDRETIDHARFFAPQWVRSNDRAITKADYEVLSNGYTDGSNGTVAKAGVICDPSDGITNLVSVFVWTADSNDDLLDTPSQLLLDSLKSFLEDRKVVTVDVSVVSGYNRAVNVTVLIRVSTKYSEDDVVSAVEDVVAGVFRDPKVRFGNELRVSWLYDEISEVPGVEWCHITDPDPSVVIGTAQSLESGSLPTSPLAGGSDTITLPSSSSSVDDYYCNYRITVTNGGTSETRKIMSYDGSTKVAKLDAAWSSITPTDGDPYELFHPRYIKLSASASSVDDVYNNRAIVLTSGAGAEQSRFIIDYDGSSNVATVNADWTTYPDATTDYQILSDLRSQDCEALVLGTLTVTVIKTQTTS